MNSYGKSKVDKMHEDKMFVHQLVQEMLNHQMSQNQIWLLIYELALNLEDVEAMQLLCTIIKDLKGSDLFISEIKDE